MRTGFDIRTDVVLEHCCHCYDNLGLITLSWTKDTRSCSSHGQSDYLRSLFSTEKEYSNLYSKIRKVDCNANSTMVFNLGSFLPVTRPLLVSCTSPGVGAVGHGIVIVFIYIFPIVYWGSSMYLVVFLIFHFFGRFCWIWSLFFAGCFTVIIDGNTLDKYICNKTRDKNINNIHALWAKRISRSPLSPVICGAKQGRKSCMRRYHTWYCFTTIPMATLE